MGSTPTMSKKTRGRIGIAADLKSVEFSLKGSSPFVWFCFFLKVWCNGNMVVLGTIAIGSIPITAIVCFVGNKRRSSVVER